MVKGSDVLCRLHLMRRARPRAFHLTIPMRAQLAAEGRRRIKYPRVNAARTDDHWVLKNYDY
jgi:hypothetical protein